MGLDPQGNLLLTKTPLANAQAQISYAYDGRDRLVVAVSPGSVSRYFYDASNRRVLSQQGVQSQEDTRSNTQENRYQPGTHRWAGGEDAQASFDANGQPQTIGQREYLSKRNNRSGTNSWELEEHGGPSLTCWNKEVNF